MNWKFFLIILIIQHSCSASTLHCSFQSGSFSFAISLYYCKVSSNNFPLNERITVDKIGGSLGYGKSYDVVKGFSVEHMPSLTYMPKNIDHFFKNLLAYQIYNTSLKEVNQSDLRVYPKLKYLYMCCNKLEVIATDLFKFNPDLELIWLHKNQISNIDPFVFSDLSKLEMLWLEGNQCGKSFGDVYNSDEIVKVVRRIEGEDCSQYRKSSQQIYEKIRAESEDLRGRIDELKEMIKTMSEKINEINGKIENKN